MRTLFLAALMAAFFMSFPVLAQAPAYCGDRAKAVAHLEMTYSETLVSIGLASNGAVVEVFASKAGTFTIIMTHPNGLSCMIAAGENWETLTQAGEGT